MVANEQSLQLGWSMDDPSLGIPNSRWCLESFIYTHLWHQEDSNYPTWKHLPHIFSFTPSPTTTIFLYPSSKDSATLPILLLQLLFTVRPPKYFAASSPLPPYTLIWLFFSRLPMLTAKFPQRRVYRALPSRYSFLWMSPILPEPGLFEYNAPQSTSFALSLVHASSPWTPSSYHWEDNVS